MVVISQTTLRRFVLGRQGLWPGRRWAGVEGTAEALTAMEGLQQFSAGSDRSCHQRSIAGGHMLIVTVIGGGDEGAALETAKALAAQALARLP